jgi:hypothetical protein
MISTSRQLCMAWLLAAAGVLTFGGRTRAGDKPPIKVEFKGWFSKPVFTADGKTLPPARRRAQSQYGTWAPPRNSAGWKRASPSTI